jgi:hypothetical protein
MGNFSQRLTQLPVEQVTNASVDFALASLEGIDRPGQMQLFRGSTGDNGEVLEGRRQISTGIPSGEYCPHGFQLRARDPSVTGLRGMTVPRENSVCSAYANLGYHDAECNLDQTLDPDSPT